MPVKVVDASALGALVFGEPGAETVAERLSNSTLVAPQLLWFELAGIALKKGAKHPGRLDQIRAAFQMAGRLAIEILFVDHLEVIDLAAQTGLTAYDASYLWLARKTGGELATLDKRLLKASAGQNPRRHNSLSPRHTLNSPATGDRCCTME